MTIQSAQYQPVTDDSLAGAAGTIKLGKNSTKQVKEQLAKSNDVTSAQGEEVLPLPPLVMFLASCLHLDSHRGSHKGSLQDGQNGRYQASN